MIFHRLRLINKNQRGFTLIEILVALAITGLITGGITGTIFQVINGSTRSSNHMTAVRQVQNAGYWVSHDGQMAQIVEPESDSDGFPLILTWTDWDGTVNVATYTIIGSELKRSHSADGDTIVARFIDSDPALTNCEFTDGLLVFTVTAAVGGDWQEQSETRVYEIVPRPGA